MRAVPTPPPSPAKLRELALQQAAAVVGNAAGDEAAVARFVLGCGVAEARLLAAQAIHNPTHLQQVYQATRETDRRVARLMQQRLAAAASQDQAARQAQTVLAQATLLAGAPALRPNQVVAVARDWQAIASPPSDAANAFATLQAKLEQRLQAQAVLQRSVLDQIARAQAALANADADAAFEAIADAARSADGTLAAAMHDAEMAGLPKHLLPELLRLLAQLQAALKTRDAAAACIAAREAALDAWEQQLTFAAAVADSGGAELAGTEEPAPADLTAAADTPAHPQPLTVAALQRAWRALPAVADPLSGDTLQQRFESLLTRLKRAPVAVPATPKARLDATASVGTEKGVQELQASASGPDAGATDNQQVHAQRGAALDALQAALEEGALQRAMEQDRLLRGLDVQGGCLTASQQASLNAARAELGRLQGWARWGGNVSREELLAAVEALPAQQLAIGELAKKVGSMRERWRALDVSAGAAPRALWSRFDAACTRAYAPVAAHFAVLSQERAVNAQKAQALIDEVAAFMLQDDVLAAPDWRALAAFSQRLRGQWQRLGPLERRQQKQLDAAFSQALEPLALQLAQRQQEELALREALIAEVGELSPQARDTPERLQALQARWQQAAKAFPLTRQEEQGCWQRFRGACDAVFTNRKNAGAAAEAERQSGLLQKQELCAALERSLHDGESSAATRAALLRDVRAAWLTAGPAPRAAQPALQARFDAAVRAIEAQRTAERQALGHRQAEAACARLALCIEGEALLLAGEAGSVGKLSERWQNLPTLDDELDAVLRRRFDALLAACAAGASGAAAHALQLQQNQADRDKGLLRLEVELGLESPPAFQRERLALQVAGLQSTFRSAGSSQARFGRSGVAQLCAVAAAANTIAQQRLNRVIGALYAAP